MSMKRTLDQSIILCHPTKWLDYLTHESYARSGQNESRMEPVALLPKRPFYFPSFNTKRSTRHGIRKGRKGVHSRRGGPARQREQGCLADHRWHRGMCVSECVQERARHSLFFFAHTYIRPQRTHFRSIFSLSLLSLTSLACDEPQEKVVWEGKWVGESATCFSGRERLCGWIESWPQCMH